MSSAVMPWELPDIKKQGHLETWTSAVSSAAMAKVTGGCPFAVLKRLYNLDVKNIHLPSQNEC